MKYGTFHGLLRATAAAPVLVLMLVLFAGPALAEQIVLYDGRDFGGPSITLNQSTTDLGNFDNEASSVRIVSGTWVLYRNANYGETPDRPSVSLGPGEYPNLENVGFPRNRLSSVQLLGGGAPPPPSPPPRACGGGTRPGPGGACVCNPGLVEAGADGQGRLVCGPASLAPPRTLPPAGATGRPAVGQQGVGQQACNAPYRIALPQGGRMVCRWACASGTVPDEASGECVCAPGMVVAGVDQGGRRMCEARQATGSQLYVVDGRQAIAYAAQRGYSFAAFRGRGRAICRMDRNEVILSHEGIPGPFGGCLALLFGDRPLAPGWSFNRLDVLVSNTVGGNTGLVIDFVSSNYTTPFVIAVRFEDPGQLVTIATIQTVSLRGPGGRDWHEAFQ